MHSPQVEQATLIAHNVIVSLILKDFFKKLLIFNRTDARLSSIEKKELNDCIHDLQESLKIQQVFNNTNNEMSVP